MGIRLLAKARAEPIAVNLENLQELRWQAELRAAGSDRARPGRLATRRPIGYASESSVNFYKSPVPGNNGPKLVLGGEWYQREPKFDPRMITPEPKAPPLVECDGKKKIGEQGCPDGKHCCDGFCVAEQDLVKEACDGKDCGKGYLPCTKGTYSVDCGGCKAPQQCCGGACGCCGVDGDSCDGDCKGMCAAGYYCHYERDGKRRCRKKEVPDCEGKCVWLYKPYKQGEGKVFKADVNFDICAKYAQDPANAWVSYNCAMLKSEK